MTTQDIANFSSPGHSYAPTPARRSCLLGSSAPARRALQEPVSTGLPRLDAALAPHSRPGTLPLGPSRSVRCVSAANGSLLSGGVRRGEVTDIAGPRGTGKTALAMELAGTVLRSGQKVIWIDTAGPLNLTRFKDILQKISPENAALKTINDTDANSLLEKLMHFHAPSLSHLLALISHPPPGFPPPDTGLIVIDSISSLFSAEFRTRMPLKHSHPPRSASDMREDRLRWKLVGNLAANLKKTAARFNCSIITTNEMASRFRPGRKPMLHEALSGTTWDSAVSTRIVLYFNWLPADVRMRIRMRRVRIAEVIRSGGIAHGIRSAGMIVPFVLQKSGVHEFSSKKLLSLRVPVWPVTLEQRRSKRKFDETFTNHDDDNAIPKSEGDVNYESPLDIRHPLPDVEPDSSANPYMPSEAGDEDNEILQELLEGEIHDMDPAVDFEDERANGDGIEVLARDREIDVEPEAEEDYGWSDDDIALVTQLLD